MAEFTVYGIDDAPAEAKPILEGAKKEMGMVPNLFGVMSESPNVLKGYKQLSELFTTSSLNAEEVTVVWQTINVENACHYCVPAHTAIASQMGVSDEITQALREEKPLPDKKLEALRQFTLAMVRQRGNPDKSTLNAFFEAGYQQQQVLDVILGIAMKTLSNYTNHVAETPLDEPFKPLAWTKKA
ncbi:MAG: carboxymuconolactone decarboxylase family protein [Oleiphilaceae bacterium]|nr:carboxymuconolactone decarboxylase family protein [Oleiphilaceae bacterium]